MEKHHFMSVYNYSTKNRAHTDFQVFVNKYNDCVVSDNVGSLRQGRTAGNFMSSRKAARAERCPPKTTAAGLDRKLML